MKKFSIWLAFILSAAIVYAGITTGPESVTVNLIPSVGPSLSGATLTGQLTNQTVRTLTQNWYATAGTPVTNGTTAYDATIVFKVVSATATGCGAQVVQTNGLDGTIETNMYGQGALTGLAVTFTNTWKGVLYSNDVVNLQNVSGTTTVLSSTEKPH